MPLRANQKPCLLVDVEAGKVLLRGGRAACMEAARGSSVPVEVISLIDGLIGEYPRRGRIQRREPAKKAAKKATKKDRGDQD